MYVVETSKFSGRGKDEVFLVDCSACVCVCVYVREGVEQRGTEKRLGARMWYALVLV